MTSPDPTLSDQLRKEAGGIKAKDNASLLASFLFRIADTIDRLQSDLARIRAETLEEAAKVVEKMSDRAIDTAKSGAEVGYGSRARAGIIAAHFYDYAAKAIRALAHPAENEGQHEH